MSSFGFVLDCGLCDQNYPSVEVQHLLMLRASSKKLFMPIVCGVSRMIGSPPHSLSIRLNRQAPFLSLEAASKALYLSLTGPASRTAYLFALARALDGVIVKMGLLSRGFLS